MSLITTAKINFGDFSLVPGSEVSTPEGTRWQLSGANDSLWLLRHQLPECEKFGESHALIGLYVFRDNMTVDKNGQFMLRRHPDYTTGLRIHAKKEKPASWQEALSLILSQEQTEITVDRGTLAEMEELLVIVASRQGEPIKYETGYKDRDGSFFQPKAICGYIEDGVAELIPIAVHVLQWFHPRGSAPNRTNYADDRYAIVRSCAPVELGSYHDRIADTKKLAAFYAKAGTDLGLTAAEIDKLIDG